MPSGRKVPTVFPFLKLPRPMSLTENASSWEQFPPTGIASESMPRDTPDEFLKDDTFYFTDVILLSQVEGYLFRVPRQSLEHEFEIFRDMFQLPTIEGSFPDGNTDRQPLRLDGIAKADFRHLLKILFPMGESSITIAEWISVLKLSALWNSQRLQALAIAKLSGLEVEAAIKLELALRYDIKEWLMPTIEDLVRREKPMGTEDVEKMGLENVLKIAALRECLHYGYETYRNHNKVWFVQERGIVPNGYSVDTEVTRKIRESFGLA